MSTTGLSLDDARAMKNSERLVMAGLPIGHKQREKAALRILDRANAPSTFTKLALRHHAQKPVIA